MIEYVREHLAVVSCIIGCVVYSTDYKVVGMCIILFALLVIIIDSMRKEISSHKVSAKHNIPIGSLVEIIPWDDSMPVGIRLIVELHESGNDEDPLYTLGTTFDSNRVSGVYESDLKVIEVY